MNSYITFKDTTEKLSSFRIDILRQWLICAAKSEGYNIGELSFNFCNDEFLHNINLEFLDHDTYTDIITFDYSLEKIIAGEIYISLDRVFENSKLFQQTVEFEIYRIIIHGLLHLLGYDDRNAEDKIQMTAKEDYYLSLLPDLE